MTQLKPNPQEDTLFEKILRGEIPSNKVYEDENTYAFWDINPQAPVHVLVIFKTKKIVNVSHAKADDALMLGQVLLAAKKVAELTGILESGYRLVINNGKEAGQTVSYLHCHVLGGRYLEWPPG